MERIFLGGYVVSYSCIPFTILLNTNNLMVLKCQGNVLGQELAGGFSESLGESLGLGRFVKYSGQQPHC